MDLNPTFFITLIVILVSIAIHEFAHAKLADSAGDPTPRIYGRVTLNPLAHLDPAGTIMIVLSSISGFGIGWGKPVPVNPSRMKNPRWDHFVSVAGGPLSNLVQAGVYAMILRAALASGSVTATGMEAALNGVPTSPLTILLTIGVMINLSLCFFNLIPLGPLDGHWLVGAFMSDPLRHNWYRWNREFGGFLLVIIVLGGQLEPRLNVLGRVLRPVVVGAFNFFTGQSFTANG